MKKNQSDRAAIRQILSNLKALKKRTAREFSDGTLRAVVVADLKDMIRAAKKKKGNALRDVDALELAVELLMSIPPKIKK